MTNVQVRIPDDLLDEIKDIGESQHTSRSEMIRRLLYEETSKEDGIRIVNKLAHSDFRMTVELYDWILEKLEG